MGTIFLFATGLVALDASALEARQSPYGKIVERNLFQLHGSRVINVDVPPKPPLRKVTLTGIATILRKPMAFITIEGTKLQPAQSVMLGTGQIIGVVEVKGIDQRAGLVKILNEGETQILSFEPPKSSDGEPIQWSPKAPHDPRPAAQTSFESTTNPEEQAALIELQRIKFEMAGDPVSAILPPTELSSNDKGVVTP